jgi:biotin carboxyl carrier protein
MQVSHISTSWPHEGTGIFRVQYDLEIEGRRRRVIVRRNGDSFAVELDGRPFCVSAVRVDPYMVSLLVAPAPLAGDRSEPVKASGRGSAFLPAGGRSYQVAFAPASAGRSVAFVESAPVGVALDGRERQRDDGARGGEGRKRITAPMPGKVVRVLVARGDVVRARQPLIVVEAMKMENEVRATGDGTVGDVHVEPGASVEAGAPLIDIL